MQIEEAKEVIQIAANFLAEQEPAAKNSRLEQIEEHQNDGTWSIVLSFPNSEPAMLILGSQATARIYKELVVSDETKEVMALRFWK